MATIATASPSDTLTLPDSSEGCNQIVSSSFWPRSFSLGWFSQPHSLTLAGFGEGCNRILFPSGSLSSLPLTLHSDSSRFRNRLQQRVFFALPLQPSCQRSSAVAVEVGARPDVAGTLVAELRERGHLVNLGNLATVAADAGVGDDRGRSVPDLLCVPRRAALAGDAREHHDVIPVAEREDGGGAVRAESLRDAEHFRRDDRTRATCVVDAGAVGDDTLDLDGVSDRLFGRVLCH